MYKVIDNFLPEEDLIKIEDVILRSIDFPWYYQPNISFDEKKSKSVLFYLIHMFYSNYRPSSNYFPLIVPLVNRLEPKALIRVKGNFYPNQGIQDLDEMHQDYAFKHKGAIFSLNTCNGGTLLKDKTLIESVRNRILLFDPSELHDSIGCTDNTKARVNININYF